MVPPCSRRGFPGRDLGKVGQASHGRVSKPGLRGLSGCLRVARGLAVLKKAGLCPLLHHPLKTAVPCLLLGSLGASGNACSSFLPPSPCLPPTPPPPSPERPEGKSASSCHRNGTHCSLGPFSREPGRSYTAKRVEDQGGGRNGAGGVRGRGAARLLWEGQIRGPG